MSVPQAAPGRDDYGELVQFRGLAPGEPFFMVRGQDAVSGDAVRAWAVLARAAGAPLALIEQALRQADRLDEWPTKKVPDAGHLPDAEQQGLAYALERRAWNARADCADLKLMLAEERAYAAARSSLRTVLADLFARGQWQAGGAFVYMPEHRDANAVEALRRLQVTMRPPQGGELSQLARSLVDEARAAGAEAERLADAGDRDPAHKALGRAAGLGHAAALVAEMAKGPA